MLGFYVPGKWTVDATIDKTSQSSSLLQKKGLLLLYLKLMRSRWTLPTLWICHLQHMASEIVLIGEEGGKGGTLTLNCLALVIFSPNSSTCAILICPNLRNVLECMRFIGSNYLCHEWPIINEYFSMHAAGDCGGTQRELGGWMDRQVNKCEISSTSGNTIVIISVDHLGEAGVCFPPYFLCVEIDALQLKGTFTLLSTGIQKNFDSAAWDILVLIILWPVPQNKMPGIVNNSIRAVFERKGQYYTCLLIGAINILLLLLIIVIRLYCFSWSVGPIYRNSLMFFLNMTWHISAHHCKHRESVPESYHFISFFGTRILYLYRAYIFTTGTVSRDFYMKSRPFHNSIFYRGV